MKTVGAFEAKTKLSELLREVQERHEEIVITKHNRNIARLTPFADSADAPDKTAIIEGFREIRNKQSAASSKEIHALINEGRKW